MITDLVIAITCGLLFSAILIHSEDDMNIWQEEQRRRYH